jgi:hypothetical protein
MLLNLLKINQILIITLSFILIILIGFVSRLIRVCLSIIDLAAPYISVLKSELIENNVDLEWRIGGASEVNKVIVYYDYFDT